MSMPLLLLLQNKFSGTAQHALALSPTWQLCQSLLPVLATTGRWDRAVY